MEAIGASPPRTIDPPASCARRTSRSARARRRRRRRPRLLDLPFDTTYRPDLPIDWLDAWDLARGEPPGSCLDAVISPRAGASAAASRPTACHPGNTLTEAAVHAIYELIARRRRR